MRENLLKRAYLKVQKIQLEKLLKEHEKLYGKEQTDQKEFECDLKKPLHARDLFTEELKSKTKEVNEKILSKDKKRDENYEEIKQEMNDDEDL